MYPNHCESILILLGDGRPIIIHGDLLVARVQLAKSIFFSTKGSFMTERDLLFETSFTFTGYWTVFYVVRMMWYSGVTLALRHSSSLQEMSARLPPMDPAAPFLAAYLREGVRGAADLAVYGLLRRGAVRFVDGVVLVLQPAVTLPTLCERCALEWAVAHDKLRPDEQTYFHHDAFKQIQTLGAALQELGLTGVVGVSRALRAWTHFVAVVFMGLGVGAAVWLYRLGGAPTVVIALVVSSALQYLWFRTDERRTGRSDALVLSYLYMYDGDRLVRLQSGRTMQWQDAMWVGGVHGVPTVWSARIEMPGPDNQPIVTAPPARWFAARVASPPPNPWGDSSRGGGEGGH